MFTPKLAIAINVYDESIPQLTACLSKIAQNLPQAQRTLFLNGPHRKELCLLAERFGFQIEGGKNLGKNLTWHIWWIRMLHFFDRTDAEVCFKFDPDTMVDRTPREYPNADYFGSVRKSGYGFPFIQGGITGLSIGVVRTIIRRNLLRYDPERNWFSHPLQQMHDLADDQLLALVLGHLGVYPTPWPECRSVWRRPILNESGEFSIVHPRYISTTTSHVHF
jgi:hypothetical protein